MPAIHLDENERRWLLKLAVDQEIAWLAVKLRMEDPQARGLPVTHWQGRLGEIDESRPPRRIQRPSAYRNNDA